MLLFSNNALISLYKNLTFSNNAFSHYKRHKIMKCSKYENAYWKCFGHVNLRWSNAHFHRFVKYWFNFGSIKLNNINCYSKLLGTISWSVFRNSPSISI